MERLAISIRGSRRPHQEEALEAESEEDEAEEEELDEDEVEEESEVYAVKVDGEELEVTLEELVNGYSRQSDYTKKTQEISEQRKDEKEKLMFFLKKFKRIQM